MTDARSESTSLSLDYAGFGIIAIKAIQEQQVEIEALKKKNSDLETRLSKLEKLLTKE